MKQAKVLLLEDELQLAKIVSESLHTRGFIVTHVVNGVLGTEAIRIDICIVDVMMPFMDGFRCLTRKAVLLKLWGDDNFFNTRTMDVFITKLRKHLQQDPSVEIINIRGVGYKLTV